MFAELVYVSEGGNRFFSNEQLNETIICGGNKTAAGD